MTIDDLRPLAVVGDYDELHAALRARVEELGISRATVGAIGGLTDGYAEKVLGTGQTKKLGALTLGLMLGALGCKLILCEDPEARRRVERRYVPRHEGNTRAALSRRRRRLRARATPAPVE